MGLEDILKYLSKIISGKNTSLKQKTIEGTLLTTISYGISQVLRFASNLILTRLLFPELFGLMSLANVFLIGLELFSDLGVGISIVQSKRGDEHKFLNTAWTIQIIRGCFLWICTFIIAFPASQFYGEPRLLWLIPILGTNTLLGGFRSTSIFTINRHLKVRIQTIFELLNQLVVLVVMISWALISPTIWSMIAGNLSAGVFSLIYSYILDKNLYDKDFKHRFMIEPEAFSEIFNFGKWIFLSTMIFFLSKQTDRLILGRLFPIELLGVYTIAFTLANIPAEVHYAISSKVIYPAFSKMAHLSRTDFRQKLISYRWYIVVPMAIFLGLLAGFGDLIITMLYDERYQQATWMFSVLALGVWPLVLMQSVDKSLLAYGKPIYHTMASLSTFLWIALMIPTGFSFSGEFGAILAIASGGIPGWLAISFGLWREKFLALGQDIVATGVLVLTLTMTLLVRSTLGFSLPFDFSNIVPLN
jgi:O-antigen/teichoic acid export membrane protein